MEKKLMHFCGNFLIYFFNIPNAVQAFQDIPENIYFQKNKSTLRCFSMEENIQLEYADTSKGITILINSKEFLSIKHEYIDCIKDEKGNILWRT